MADTSPEGASASFERLHEGVRRWIWQQGWEELRDIQERSIPVLLGEGRDLIIAASTASGKTEAAFLPIVSRLARENREPGGGFDAIYVSPLRALINDQFGRLESLCEELAIPVVKWHGDVAASVKARARKKPGGILLTTPESLEAILCRRGTEVVRLFGTLSHIVIDELHAFLDEPRGRQLQSLLHRIEGSRGHRVTRIGLSATLADMRVAAAFLRPGDGEAVDIVTAAAGSGGLRLQLRGYLQPAKVKTPEKRSAGPQASTDTNPPAPDSEGVADAAIAQHIFETLRGTRSLIFAGSRRRVELLTADLGVLTEAAGVPDEFFAHHGSLSRDLREEAERRLKDESRPASIVCTTTLELGIDVGHIEQVAQCGPGRTVSGMRQRLGRSGRRKGQSAVMRIYVRETEVDRKTHPIDALRLETVQAAAMVNLMLRRWNEPTVEGRLHLSTLVHQILALIAQHGGITAAQGWSKLCASGVFGNVDAALYQRVLRRMAHADVLLIEQVADGTLLPGAEGEKVLSGHDFYAVFMTPDEYRVITDTGRSLGTVPIEYPLIPGQLIIFGGRRWRVLEIDPQRREIRVTRAFGGTPPKFGGETGAPDQEVVREMRAIWEAEGAPTYLDPNAASLLAEGRAAYRRYGLHRTMACRHAEDILLFPWCGSRAQTALSLALAARKVENSQEDLALSVPARLAVPMRAALAALAAEPAPDPVGLAAQVADKIRDKYDHHLDEGLLRLDWASEYVDAARVPVIASELLAGLPAELD